MGCGMPLVFVKEVVDEQKRFAKMFSIIFFMCNKPIDFLINLFCLFRNMTSA